MNCSKWAIITSSFSLLLFFFQNCGKGFESNGQVNSLSYCQVGNSAASPFASQKVFLPKNYFSSQQKLSTNSLKFNLTVDVQCLLQGEQELRFLGQKIQVKGILREQSKAVLPIALSPGTPLDQIDAEFEKSSCFLGMTEEQTIYKNQVSTARVNDPQSTSQKHLNVLEHDASLPLQADINEEVIIAFIDSGVDYDHPDLSQRMWTDTDGSHGYNYISLTPRPMDDDGHGTHVAGITAAIENNRVGVAGLTSDYVKIMAIKVLDRRGEGSSTDVANGIYYAIRRGADIINLSIEAPGQKVDIEAAILDAVQAGVVITTATGNQASEITQKNLFAPAYMGPSVAGVISVASVDTQNLELSSFSNYSKTYAEIAAPGAENSSSVEGGILSTQLGGGWVRIRGTSQATPMVTAAAAILIGYLKTKNITYTPAGIESFITSDGVMTRSNLESYVNGGRILNLGFLSANLLKFLSSGSLEDNSFDGDETTGQTCVLN